MKTLAHETLTTVNTLSTLNTLNTMTTLKTKTRRNPKTPQAPRSRSRRGAIAFCALLAATGPAALATAQWNSNPSQNTLMASDIEGSAQARALVQSGSGAICALVQGAGNKLAVQVLNSAGNRQLGTSGSVIDAGPIYELCAVSDSAGGMIVAYRKNGDIFAQIVDSTGAVVAGPTALCTLGASSGSGLDITSDGAGGAIVVWREVGTAGQEIRVQRVKSDGTTDWTGQGVALTYVWSPALVWRARIVTDTAGGAFVGWVHQVSAGVWATPMTRRIDASGTPLWSERPVTVNAPPTERLWLEMASDGAGRALYGLYHWPWSGSSLLITQRVDAAGNQEWPITSGIKSGIVTFDNTNGMIGIDDGSFDVESDGAGGAVVVMNRSGTGFTDGPIMGQRVNGDLSVPLQWGGNTVATPVLVSSSHANYHPRMLVDGAVAIVTWTAFANSKLGTSDIHAQRILLSTGAKTWGTSGDVVLGSAASHQQNPLIVKRSTCSWIVSFIDGRNSAWPPEEYCQVVSHHSTAGARLYPGPCSGIIWHQFTAIAAVNIHHVVGQILVGLDDGLVGFEPHLTDGSGTVAGTLLLKDIRKGREGSAPQDFTKVDGGVVFFTADDGQSGRELWRTDGTAAGTQVCLDVRPGSGSSMPRDLTAVGSALFFTADDGVHGRELWRTDGRPGGTRMVHDLEQGPNGSIPNNLVELGGTLLFAASTSATGSELYRTDGTQAGTSMVLDLNKGQGSATPCCLTRLGGEVFFVAFEPATGAELYRTDGTARGTSLVLDIMPGTLSSSPRYLTAAGNRLFFAAGDRQNGRELFMTDGTAAGTALVLDIVKGAGSGDPQSIATRGDGVVFSADDSVHGREIWGSDGTPAGTRMLRDLQPGQAGSDPQAIATVGSRRCFFSADDGQSGRELFVTDGTEAGTGMVADLTEGAASSDPRGLSLVLGKLALFADDGTATRLVLVEPGATSQAFGCGCSSQAPAGRPELSASDPVLGETMRITGSGAPAGAFAATLIGFPSARPFPLAGCSIHLELWFPPITVHTGPVQSAEWEFGLPLPRGEALGGLRMALQTFYVGAAGISATNAVELNLGH